MKVEIGDNGVWIMEGKWRNDLQKISARGKYCGSSSAVVSFIKLKSSFDKIQNFGKKMDKTGVHIILESPAFRGVETTLGRLKLDLETVETWYKHFYYDVRSGLASQFSK